MASKEANAGSGQQSVPKDTNEPRWLNWCWHRLRSGPDAVNSREVNGAKAFAREKLQTAVWAIRREYGNTFTPWGLLQLSCVVLRDILGNPDATNDGRDGPPA